MLRDRWHLHWDEREPRRCLFTLVLKAERSYMVGNKEFYTFAVPTINIEETRLIRQSVFYILIKFVVPDNVPTEPHADDDNKNPAHLSVDFLASTSQPVTFP